MDRLQRIADILDLVDGGFYTIDQDWRIRLINRLAANYFGCDPDACVGQRLHDIATGLEGSKAGDCMRAAFQQQKMQQVEFESPRTRRRFELQAAPFEDGLAIHFRDVTDMREAQARLTASLKEFKQLAEAMPQLVWVAEAEGRVIYYNEQVHRYDGFSRREDGVWEWAPTVHPDELPLTIDLWSQALQHRTPYQCEHRIRMATGELRWHLSRARFYAEHEGAGGRWFGTATDIHETKTAQTRLNEKTIQLEQQAERLRLATEIGGVGVYSWNVTQDLIEWDATIYAIFGMESSFPLTMDRINSFIHPEDVESVQLHLSDAVASGGEFHLEYRIVRTDGVVRHLRSAGTNFEEPEGHLLVGVIADITSEREREAELERNVRLRTAELEAANREMEAFTYSVSHDLRAPLRAISAASQILIEELGGSLSAEYHQLLVRQSYNANRLATLLDDLLRLSRISRQPMRLSSFDFSAVAHEMLGTCQEGNDFQVQPGITAFGDVDLVRLILANLIENACRYSEGRGTVEIGADSEARPQAFFVRDEGIGLDMQYAHRIFRPFERLHRDEEYSGTGIGLATVRRAVERHGGRAWVISAVGEGAIFWFTLEPDES